MNESDFKHSQTMNVSAPWTEMCRETTFEDDVCVPWRDSENRSLNY